MSCSRRPSSVGCALAGLGGAIGAGILSLEPSYALKYVVLFLVVVIVGGEGSFKGSFVAAMALGIIDTSGKYFVTQAARLSALRRGLHSLAMAAAGPVAAEIGGMMTTPSEAPPATGLGAWPCAARWRSPATPCRG